MKILMVFGTRPEAIKMCPLALAIEERENFECIICLTGQHREMLQQVMDVFGLIANYNLNIMKPSQSLYSITANILCKLEDVLKHEKPDIVLVHGDTTTALAASIASFYMKIPVGHIEAGLRTGNLYSPFPEEMNRQVIDRIATYLFVPTEKNKVNLEKEGITNNVYITGNTVIDAFKYTVKENYKYSNEILRSINYNKKIIVVTAHRRENWGEPLKNICTAIRTIANKYKNVVFVYPVHLNPSVRDTVENILSGVENVHLLEPLNVIDMHNLISNCYMVFTDSGGLQEEAPSFGKPVLVMRNTTERPEAVEAGTVKIVGTDYNNIISVADQLLNDEDEYLSMANAINPYGDGKASLYITNILEEIDSE